MAAVPITINGVLCDKYGRTIQQVVLVGDATITGVGVGGGPIVPPEGGGEGPPSIWPSPGHPAHPIAPGGPPPGIWGPNDPRPTPPIVLPPYEPGGPPVGIWPSPGHPAHPIVIPEPPPQPEGSPDKPPPEEGGWGFSGDWQKWVMYPGPTSPQPKG